MSGAKQFKKKVLYLGTNERKGFLIEDICMKKEGFYFDEVKDD